MEKKFILRDYWKKVLTVCFAALILAGCFSITYSIHLWELGNIKERFVGADKWLICQRAWIFFFVFVFIGLHFIFPVKKMYEWMFDKRWLIGMLFLLFLTANRYNGDSLTYYSYSIQPNTNTSSMQPILGKIRPIRSDEWVVNSPSILASTYGDDAFGKYNTINRGTETLNIVSGVYGGYATLGYAPWKLVYLFLPVEFAFSFCWFAPIILTFLMSIELYMILTKNNKIVSTTGAVMTVGSSFYLWWAFPTFLIAAPATIVFIHYFLHDNTRWKRVLYGIGIAISFSVFVTSLYPAWQVPAGYVFLVIGLWLICSHWEEIKGFSKKDWLIFFGCIAIMLSLILSYFFTAFDYIKAVTETVYPGARSDAGGFGINKIFYYAQAPFYAYQEIANASESGVFLSLFPIPTIMMIYCWIRSKKKDWMHFGLIAVSMVLIIYSTFGLPSIVAKLLLLDKSMPGRVVDIIGLIQIYFIVIVLSRYIKEKKMNKNVAAILGCATSALAVYVSYVCFPDYLNMVEKVVMFVVISGLCVGLMIQLSDKMKTRLCIGFIALSIITGICVRPVSVGLGSLFDKPVAKEIQEICEKDPKAKWITYGGGIVLPSYSIACGASTINSVNAYPNMKLWTLLDENNKYEQIYNRYAHIQVAFTDEDTSFELVNNQADFMQINLSYKDIQKTDAKYILTIEAPETFVNNEYVTFDTIYQEDGTSIVKINYN